MNEELRTIDNERPAANAAAGDDRPPVDYLWLAGCALVTAVAAFVRFFWLEVKPLHHDEGVNSFFLTTLFRAGEYKYDPANYHGPDLYYLALAFVKAFGLNTFSIRASVAVFGVLTVVLAFFLRRHLGRTGSLLAAFFLALSPGMTYISRYFIHEILFVFLSFGIALALVLFVERRRAGLGAIVWTTLLLLVCFLPSALNLANVLGGESGALLWTLRVVFFLVEAALVYFVMRMLLGWHEGRPIYLILAAASIVLLFATKETAFITIGTQAIACACVWLWLKIGAAEGFAKNRFGFAMAATLAALGGALVGYGKIKEGLKSVYDNFQLAENPVQTGLFYAILALAAAAAATWVVFAVLNRRAADSELPADAGLSWTNLRARLAAADTREIALVKSALGGLTIALVWFFVRYAIGWLTAWKAGQGAALEKVVLSKVDFWILAAAFACLAVAALLWRARRPRKVSTDLVLMTAAAIVVFLYVGALFFSSFFTYPEGLQRAFEAYAIWTKTGNTDHTQNGGWAYLRWGMIIEAPLFILSALGTLIAFYKARHRFAMFAGLWAFGLLAAYTLIPYKTPWLALSFLLPMCLVAGYGLGELLGSRRAAEKALGALLAVAASAILAYQTYDINFVRYDSDAMPYIYAHTRREFLDLVRQMNYYADKSGQGRDARIEIVSPDYWPMPWYTNDYPNAVYQGKPVDVNSAELIIAKEGEQNAEIVARYAARYRYAGTYPLRPGVDLVLLVRSDLADSDAADIYAVFGEPLVITPGDDFEGLPPIATEGAPTEKAGDKKTKD